MESVKEPGENKITETNDLTFSDVIQIIVFTPIKEIGILANQVKYKYTHIFPLVYGILFGINRAMVKTTETDNRSILLSSFFLIIGMIISSFLACLIHAWLVRFISNLLHGSANLYMTFSIISYALVPLIIRSFLFLILRIGVYSSTSFQYLYTLNYRLFYYSHFVFMLWSLFILIIGNAFINKFSIVKSIISSLGVVLLMALGIVLNSIIGN